MFKTTRTFELQRPNMHGDPKAFEAWEASVAKQWKERPSIRLTAHDGRGEHMEEAQVAVFHVWDRRVDRWLSKMTAQLAKDWRHVQVEVIPGVDSRYVIYTGA